MGQNEGVVEQSCWGPCRPFSSCARGTWMGLRCGSCPHSRGCHVVVVEASVASAEATDAALKFLAPHAPCHLFHSNQTCQSMNAIMIKIFAVALALSQVTTKPDVKTEFDPVRDPAQAMQLLRDGCKHMLKVFDLENINIDELITIAMNDPQAVTAESKAFKGINFDDLAVAYREICKGESVAKSPIVMSEVLAS